MFGRRNLRCKVGILSCIAFFLVGTMFSIMHPVMHAMIHPMTHTIMDTMMHATANKSIKNPYLIEDWCQEPNDAMNKTYIEDLFEYNLTFIDGFKNPCFYDHCNSIGSVRARSLRCLPYFHVLGVDKCGSTDLFSRIARHPQILGNKGSLEKETMWWSWKRYGFLVNRPYDRKETLHRYLQYFDDAAGQILSFTTETGYHPLIAGEGTPMDFWDFSGWTQLVQNKYRRIPKVKTPHLIKHINPEAKFILLFRDPTDRLYSDYIFLGLGKSNPKAFHTAVLDGINIINNCTKQHGTKSCLFSRDIHLKLTARLHVSMYSVYLTEWLNVFPRERFLIFRTEDFAENITSHLQKAFEFLDVFDIPKATMDSISKQKKTHVTREKRKAGPMLQETRKILDTFFQPYIDELVNITKDLKFLWADTRLKRQKKEKEDMKKSNAQRRKGKNNKNQRKTSKS